MDALVAAKAGIHESKQDMEAIPMVDSHSADGDGEGVIAERPIAVRGRGKSTWLLRQCLVLNNAHHEQRTSKDIRK